MANIEWTNPYCGVEHSQKDTLGRCCTVNTYSGGLARLSKWYLGCQFSPEEAIYSNTGDAKRAGEAWLLGAQC